MTVPEVDETPAPKKRASKKAATVVVEPVKASKKEVPAKPSKIYKRTAEYWTFQKGLRGQGGPWLLAKVEAAKA